MKGLVNIIKKHIIPFLIGAAVTSGIYQATPKSTPTPTPVIQQQTKVEYAFTQAKQHPDQKLEAVINSAKSDLDIAIYSITENGIVDSIVNAKKRGVNIRIITDSQQAGNKYQAEDLHRLQSLGIPIKKNNHSGLMHLKVTIADKSIATTGSFNYSNSASTINDEVFVVIRDSNIAKEWDAQFERMWNDTKGFEEFK